MNFGASMVELALRISEPPNQSTMTIRIVPSSSLIGCAIDWRIAVILLAVFALAYLATKYVSLGSILGSAMFAVGFTIFHHDNPLVMTGGIFIGLLALFMHRSNILRLIKGQERKTDLFQKNPE